MIKYCLIAVFPTVRWTVITPLYFFIQHVNGRNKRNPHNQMLRVIMLHHLLFILMLTNQRNVARVVS